MTVKVFTKKGLKIIERKYNYKKYDMKTGQGGLVPKDKIIEEVKNVPLPQIEFRLSADPTLCHSPPSHLRRPEDL